MPTSRPAATQIQKLSFRCFRTQNRATTARTFTHCGRFSQRVRTNRKSHETQNRNCVRVRHSVKVALHIYIMAVSTAHAQRSHDKFRFSIFRLRVGSSPAIWTFRQRILCLICRRLFCISVASEMIMHLRDIDATLEQMKRPISF